MQMLKPTIALTRNALRVVRYYAYLLTIQRLTVLYLPSSTIL